MTALSYAEDHERALRRALLERLATDIATIASPDVQWTCCWVPYDGPRGERWLYQLCGGMPPGGLPYGSDGRRKHCGHWHHGHEVFLA